MHFLLCSPTGLLLLPSFWHSLWQKWRYQKTACRRSNPSEIFSGPVCNIPYEKSKCYGSSSQIPGSERALRTFLLIQSLAQIDCSQEMGGAVRPISSWEYNGAGSSLSENVTLTENDPALLGQRKRKRFTSSGWLPFHKALKKELCNLVSQIPLTLASLQKIYSHCSWDICFSIKNQIRDAVLIFVASIPEWDLLGRGEGLDGLG